jgi:FMN reductase
VALAVADALETRLDITPNRLVIDLADIATELFDQDSQQLLELRGAVAVSQVAVVASPTFKATYTGLLKAFFDGYATNALGSLVAVGVMTGAAPIHALAVEVHLRPLLVELGAVTPTRGLYVTEQQFDDLDHVVGPWADVAGPLIARHLA